MVAHREHWHAPFDFVQLHFFDSAEKALSQRIKPSWDADFRTVEFRNVEYVNYLIEMGANLRKV
jgi:hypothetical protein